MVALEPLTIECRVPVPPPMPFSAPGAGDSSALPEPEAVTITIATDEDTRVLKVVDSSFEDIQMGENVMAAGRREDATFVARVVVVGTQLRQFLPQWGGFGGGPGGMFGLGAESPLWGLPRFERED